MAYKKSQVSVEFIIYISFAFIMTVGFLAAAGAQIKDFSDSDKIDKIISFGNSIQKEIELASVVKEGYQRNIELPEKINNYINYTVRLENSELIIDTEYYQYSSIVPITMGSLDKGKNTLENQNSTVVIKNG